MKTFLGHVEEGHGVAGDNLEDILALIGERVGLPPMFKGTLNVRIEDEYRVPADVTIPPEEYNEIETLYLKRCRIRGVRCCIMRPDHHEMVPEDEPERRRDALTRLEIMSDRKLRDALDLSDGDIVEVEIDGDDAWWTK